jgi:ketosteroid isomerase-like protein
MNKTWLACLLASLSLVSASLSDAQTSDSTEKAVLALENQWMKSQKENNPDILAPLLADKFVVTNSAGKVRNKTEALANARATKYSSVEYQDMKVTVYGDTAIATGGFKGQGTDDSGKAFNTHSRWTDTWVKMPDGKWQCVASHGSDIKK